MPTKTMHRAVNPTTERVLTGLDIVTARDIADRIGVSVDTLAKWVERSKAYRGKPDENGIDWAFPEPRWTVARGTTKLWLFDVDIMPWLVLTGRDGYKPEIKKGGKK